MKLKHVVSMTAGGTPDVNDPSMWAEDSEGVAWVSIADMSSGVAVVKTERRLSIKGVANRRLHPMPPGTVLFAMYASVGAVAVLDVEATWNQALVGLTPRGGLSEGRFVSYWLQNLRPDLGALTRTSTQANLNAEQVGNLPFSHLPLVDQVRVADFLDDQVGRIDEIIRLREEQLPLVRSRLASQLNELLVQPFGGRDEHLQRLTDRGRPIQYGIVLPGPDVDDGVPIVKGGDIGNSRLSLSQLKRTTHAIEAPYARSRLRGGDLVIAIRGSVGEVGRVPDELTGANLTQDAARIAPWGCDSDWLHALLEAPTIQQRMAEVITGATVKGINIGALRRLLVPVPPTLEIQRTLGTESTSLRTSAEILVGEMRSQIQLLRERKRSLITAAVTGEFDVSTASGRGVA